MIKKFGLLLVITACLIGFSYEARGATPSRNIFQKPTTTKSAQTKPVSSPVVGPAVVDEAKVKELMRILNQNATVTYPFIASTKELKQSESEMTGALVKPTGWFEEILPYLLGLIVLLILVIIIVLLRWLRQESRTFLYLQREQREERVAPVIQAGLVQQFVPQPEARAVNQQAFSQPPVINKKVVVTSPAPEVKKTVKKSNEVIDLKEIAIKKKPTTKKRFSV
ncbi:MAG: hypothetical protein NTV81_01425 [Candidatus Komeilibacteria bacterium]|nr:hypothetical protein [Candidatus Komeilibacteria bacterium]